MLSKLLHVTPATFRLQRYYTMPAYLGQKDAQQLDEDLMSDEGAFKLEQLMELAGLSCAQALQDAYPELSKYRKVLVCCGPGNQGGDGLVAIRHLFHFGYKPLLYYPKQGSNEFYKKLRKQCLNLSIPEIGSSEQDFQNALDDADIVMDAIFGFSFHGDPRPPFDTVISALKQTKKPIVSVDIPSGWTVEEGDPSGRFFVPSVLVSLTAPKLGVRSYKGKHYLGQSLHSTTDRREVQARSAALQRLVANSRHHRYERINSLQCI